MRFGIAFYCLISLFIFLVPNARAVNSSYIGIEKSNVEYIDDPLAIARANEFGLLGLDSSFDIRNIIITILKYLMSFFGIIAVCVIMSAGFRLKVASGSEEKIRVAKSMILGGIIGMSTVVGAFMIVNLVVKTTSLIIEEEL